MELVIKQLNDSLMELEAAADHPSTNDMIYAWNTGLGVRIAHGQHTVTGVLNVTAAAPGQVFLNGKNEMARYMLRTRAIRLAMDSVHAALKILERG